MNKRCTNSSCRKVFSTLTYGGQCPFCGKTYPQLNGTGITVNGKGCRLSDAFWAVYRLEAANKLRQIILLRADMEACGFYLGLRDAKETVEAMWTGVRRFSWRLTDEYVNGRRVIDCSRKKPAAPPVAGHGAPAMLLRGRQYPFSRRLYRLLQEYGSMPMEQRNRRDKLELISLLRKEMRRHGFSATFAVLEKTVNAMANGQRRLAFRLTGQCSNGCRGVTLEE
ncbi:MAG: hypothetical protein ACI4O7_11385 [Aristaeellaceae bacterium]